MGFIDGLKFFGVVGIASLSLTAVANAKSVTKTKMNGAVASYTLSDGTHVVDLSVFRNDTNTTAAVTNFNFQRYTCDADTCSGVIGFGVIPNSEFKVDTKHARLNVQLASVPGYTAFSFVRDVNTGESTNTPITPPNVDIDWKPLTGPALLEVKSTGTQVVKVGSTTTKTSGTNTYVQASVMGSIGGVPLISAGSDNRIGTNENVSMEIIRD